MFAYICYSGYNYNCHRKYLAVNNLIGQPINVL